jgi:predicted nuclease of restriction endonuclease-like (RecB) superfamily
MTSCGGQTPDSFDTPADYVHLLAEVKTRIRDAQYEALRAVNRELVGLYWDIGRMIVERQADAQHGSSIAERLAADLRSEFPDISGFSRRNIFYMREFYMLYRDDKRVQPLVAQLGWSHNLAILQRCKDSLEREFYIRMTRKFGWSKNVLIHHIDNQSYEKSLLGQHNFDQALTPALRNQAKLAVRDGYTFAAGSAKNVRLEPRPGSRAEIIGTHGFVPEPPLGRDDDLAPVSPQPCPPPAEAAVCRDVMPAEAHEPHVIMALTARIMIHVQTWKPNTQRSSDPGHIVGKNIKKRIFDIISDVLYRFIVIFKRTCSVKEIIISIRNIISPANMNTY